MADINKHSYTADDIKKLDGIEAVRLKTGDVYRLD